MPDKARIIAAEPHPEPQVTLRHAMRSAPPGAAETEALPPPKELGGRDGPEPVRYGDWEKNGRCIDF